MFQTILNGEERNIPNSLKETKMVKNNNHPAIAPDFFQNNIILMKNCKNKCSKRKIIEIVSCQLLDSRFGTRRLLMGR